MRNELFKDVSLADIESRVINSMRSIERLKNNLAETLAMIQKMQTEERKAQAALLHQIAKDHRREQILDLLATGKPVAQVAKQFNTSPRSIRRVLDKAKAEGDARVARWANGIVPADSSQSASRSLGNQASDPVAGTIGEPTTEPLGRDGQSEEERTEETSVEVTVAPQAGNEAGSGSVTEAEGETVSAGRAAETAEEGDTSSPEPEITASYQYPHLTTVEPEPDTFRSLGDIAKDILDRRWRNLNEQLKAAEDELQEETKRLPDLDDLDDLNVFSPPVETTVVGIDLASEPDKTVIAHCSKEKGITPVPEEVLVLTPLRDEEPRRGTGHRVVSTPAGLEVDLETNTVVSNHGAQKVDRMFAKVLRHMQDGGLYAIDVLAQRAGYPKTDLVKDSLRAWKPKLEEIGIEVVALTKTYDLVQLRRLVA